MQPGWLLTAASAAAAASAAVDLLHGHLFLVDSAICARLSTGRDHIRFWDIANTDTALGAVEKSIYSAEYQRLCEVLRRLRLDAGLTQVEVAAELGEPQSFVSKYESGERRLDVIELRHVARALRTTVWTVLERLEE